MALFHLEWQYMGERLALDNAESTHGLDFRMNSVNSEKVGDAENDSFGWQSSRIATRSAGLASFLGTSVIIQKVIFFC